MKPVVSAVGVAANGAVDIVAKQPGEPGVGPQADVVPAALTHVIAIRVEIPRQKGVLKYFNIKHM